MPPKLWPTITRSGFPRFFLSAVAIMAQPPEQLPDRSDRHPLSGRLPLPERGVRDDVARGANADSPRQPRNPQGQAAPRPRAEARVLAIDPFRSEHTKRGEVLVVRAGVVLPSVHEDDQITSCPGCAGSGASASSLFVTPSICPRS